MLKASSLLYAIFVCLIVSLLSGSLILIFSYQYRLKQQYFLEEELLTAANNNLIQILDQFNENVLDVKGVISADNDEIHTSYAISKWGFYDLLKIKTYHKKDTLYKVGLIGDNSKKENLALYVSDLDKPLKVGGKTKIIGNAKISKYGVSPAYISNQPFSGGKLIEGDVGVSGKRLPELKKVEKTDFEEEPKVMSLDEIRGEKMFSNSFYKPTIIVQVTEASNIDNIALSGNFIVQSKDSLHIKRSVSLNDILIKAPIVTFEDEFSGTVQVFAERGVYLGKEVALAYPSSIYIDYDPEKATEVFLGEKSKLAGGVVFTGKKYPNSLNRLITIEEDAEVIGDVYCYGKVQLKGRVTGTLYTDRFYLKTTATIYENHIVNGEINSLELPDNFINLPLFANENSRYELIKEL